MWVKFSLQGGVVDCFGADPGFAFELLGRHEEIKQGNQGPVDGGEEGLLLKTRKAVVTNVFTNHGSVVLLNKLVVIFLMVAATGEGEGFLLTPDFGGVVNTLRAVVTVQLLYRQEGGFFQAG